MKKKNDYYDNRIVFKPWGHEYVVYRYRNLLSVTLLHINPKKSTSLHCHPKKKNWLRTIKWQSINSTRPMEK